MLFYSVCLHPFLFGSSLPPDSNGAVKYVALFPKRRSVSKASQSAFLPQTQQLLHQGPHEENKVALGSLGLLILRTIYETKTDERQSER